MIIISHPLGGSQTECVSTKKNSLLLRMRKKPVVGFSGGALCGGVGVPLPLLRPLIITADGWYRLDLVSVPPPPPTTKHNTHYYHKNDQII